MRAPQLQLHSRFRQEVLQPAMRNGWRYPWYWLQVRARWLQRTHHVVFYDRPISSRCPGRGVLKRFSHAGLSDG